MLKKPIKIAVCQKKYHQTGCLNTIKHKNYSLKTLYSKNN